MSYIFLRLRRRIKLKSTFQRFILSFILIISFILFFSNIILYNRYKKQIIEQSGVISEKLLKQAHYYTEYTLRWAMSYIYQLYLDKDIYNLIFNRITDINDISTGVSKIKQAVAINPSIQSIYVYNYTDKKVYPSDGEPSDHSSFYDKDIGRLLRENEETFSTKFIPRKVEMSVNGLDYTKDVLTLMLMNTDESQSHMPCGAIIINLNAVNVQNYYNNMTEEEYNILAIDNSGRIVLNSDPDLFLEDVSDREYVKRILNSEDAIGSFFGTVSNKPSVITYASSPRLGLKFINIIPYETLTDSINNMLLLLVSSTLVLFLLGIVIAFVSFKKIFSPFDKVIKTIREYFMTCNDPEIKANANGSSENDADYLTKVVDIIMSKPFESRRLSSMDIQFIKNQLLKGLLLNTPFEINSFKSKLKDLEVNIDFCNIIVVLFKIDSYKGVKEKLTNSIYNHVVKMLENEYRNEIVATDEDELCMIVSIGDEMKDNITENLIGLIKSVQSALREKYHISVSAAIGDYVENIADTSKSYKSAGEYINYRFKYGYESILHKSKIESGICRNVKYDKGMEEAVFKELKAGNIEKAERELEKLFDSIMELSYSDIVLAVSHILDSSQKVADSMLQMSGSSMEIYEEKFYNDIGRFQTCDETKSYLFSFYQDIINQLKDKKKNRKNDLVCSIINYVNENYHDPLLTIESIAENLSLSPNYLRVLFKEVKQKSLSFYISEVRFEKAKFLLKSTDLTVAEISEKVGFTNTNYFYTAFKKLYGISPSYYRSNIKSIGLNVKIISLNEH